MSMFSVTLTQPPNPFAGTSQFITTVAPGPGPVMYVSTPHTPYMSNAEAAARAADYFIGALRSEIEKAILDQLNAANPAGDVPEGQMISWKNPSSYVVPPYLFAQLAQAPPFSGSEDVLGTLERVFPGLKHAPKVPPPCTGLPIESSYLGHPCTLKVACPIPSLVMHLNDDHKWTREQIADWLDTLDIDLSAKPNTEKESAA